MSLLWDPSCQNLLEAPWTLTYGLHCSSFLGLLFGILNIELVKPKKGTTMDTKGRIRSRVCSKLLMVSV